MEWLIIGLFGASIAIFALVDLARRPYKKNTRLFWFAIVILVPLIGPFAFFLIRKSLPMEGK
jgi:hypothetical protein